mmetsp:Transcript_100117/g.137874  ORF Transcript_100117/g.137874 Transcript_100117/m.137874 type:complete len:128 (+) Transcript_100117:250-633(+)
MASRLPITMYANALGSSVFCRKVSLALSSKSACEMSCFAMSCQPTVVIVVVIVTELVLVAVAVLVLVSVLADVVTVVVIVTVPVLVSVAMLVLVSVLVDVVAVVVIVAVLGWTGLSGHNLQPLLVTE